MKSYGEYCPIPVGVEYVGERWFIADPMLGDVRRYARAERAATA